VAELERYIANMAISDTSDTSHNSMAAFAKSGGIGAALMMDASHSTRIPINSYPSTSIGAREMTTSATSFASTTPPTTRSYTSSAATSSSSSIRTASSAIPKEMFYDDTAAMASGVMLGFRNSILEEPMIEDMTGLHSSSLDTHGTILSAAAAIAKLSTSF